MSAFEIPTAHIDALITAGLKLDNPRRTLKWSNRLRELTRETAGQVGAMLLAENQRSLNHCYQEHEWEQAYVFHETARTLDPVVVLKAIECYEYQSCEHNAWKHSEAAAFCDSLRRAMIQELPGFDKAPAWPLQEESGDHAATARNTLIEPRRPWRIIRGPNANYKTCYYSTQKARDQAAKKFATQDRNTVMVEQWSADHPQDYLNRGWACAGAITPLIARIKVNDPRYAEVTSLVVEWADGTPRNGPVVIAPQAAPDSAATFGSANKTLHSWGCLPLRGSSVHHWIKDCEGWFAQVYDPTLGRN